MRKQRLAVIGGGPAGFFCAVNAARMNPALEVIILEKSGRVLSKVKVSGGGRCNLTHACFDISEMAAHYPRGRNFVKRAFHQFFTTDTIQWFKERGVDLKQEADGRMFPVSDSSQTIIDCLLREADLHKVQWVIHREVKSLERAGQGWRVKGEGHAMESDFVCVACGGFPRASLFAWLQDLGHTIEDPVPSLFGFAIPGSEILSLGGVAVKDVSVRVVGSRLQERGPLLITHRGLSGPVILRLSAWAARELAARQYHFSVLVNWLPSLQQNALRDDLERCRRESAVRKIRNRNPFALPRRLWEYALRQAGIREDLRWGDLPSRERNRLLGNLCGQEFVVEGRAPFKEEFVTAGGVQLGEVDVRGMMSKRQAHLFFAGEVLDVDGITGGFNFQHAWTSGFIAAKGIAALAHEG